MSVIHDTFAAKLQEVLAANGYEGLLSDEQAARFTEAARVLIAKNEELNLTAITDVDGILFRHYVDSLTVVPKIPEGARMCDIGAGAGFPSLPVAIARPDVRVLAVDSVGKKMRALNEQAEALGVKNLSAMSARAEEMGKDKKYRETFDFVTARAVTRLNVLAEFCLPLLKMGGTLAAMKAKTADEELAEAKNAIEKLGGTVREAKTFTLEMNGEILERTIVLIDKTAPTPAAYPRNFSQISKKPL